MKPDTLQLIDSPAESEQVRAIAQQINLQRIGITWIAIITTTVFTAISVTLPRLSTVAQVFMQTTADRKTEAGILVRQGGQQGKTSQFQAALQSFQQALSIYRKIGDRQGEAHTLSSVAHIYFDMNRYELALQFYQQALALQKQIGAIKEEASSLDSLTGIYNNLGQYQRSLQFGQQALAIYRQLGNQNHEGYALQVLGDIYNYLGQHQQAIQFQYQALNIARHTGDRLMEAFPLLSLGNTYSSLGHHQQAIQFYQKTLELARQTGNGSLEAVSLGNLGSIYQSLGNQTRAIHYIQQFLARSRALNSRVWEALAFRNLASSFLRIGNLVEAENNVRAAIEIEESFRSGLTDSNQISIFEGQASTYRLLQEILIAENKVGLALEKAEQGRARALVELLFRRSSQKPVETPYPTQPQPIVNSNTIQQIQQVAREQNATLVEYSVPNCGCEENLFIWVVKPTGEVALRRVNLKTPSLQQTISLDDLVTTSRDSIGVRGRAGGVAVVAIKPTIDQTNHLKQLHQLLIEPVADLLPTDPAAHIVFLPQSSLFLVPFPALQDPKGHYLIEQHTILTAPSIQVLQLTHQQRAKVPGQAKGIMVAGNPIMPIIQPPGQEQQQLPQLSGAEQEAKDVAQLLHTQALVGNQATKAAILPELPKARIIHFATHGLLDDFKGGGVPGAIALGPSHPGTPNDGLLTADEILDMKLNAELVVLSACNTGQGKITGDGVVGLSRSLITAGVPSIIVSLWSVPDAPTASLMKQFYTNLQHNPDKAQALRQAMLTTMKEHPEPRDWAAFTLIGEAQ